jgi:hypothetical protein
MAQKHRKCDSANYKKSQKKIKLHHLAKAALRKEQEHREWERGRQWREDQEMIRQITLEEKRHSLQRIANLISFHIWQVDPEYYNHWATRRHLSQVMGIFGLGREYFR